MTELGARLKEARVQKGYSLDNLQEITKIQKRYLVGIEEGNYSSMPGAFYVRAFIKQYAEAVGLNPNEILEQYQNEIPNTQVTEVTQSYTKSQSSRKLVKKASSSKMMETVPKIIVALFAIVIVIVAVSLISKKINESNPPVEEDTDKPFVIEKKPVTKDPVEDDEEDKENDSEETNEEDTTEEEPIVTQTISPAVLQADGQTFEYTVTNAEQMIVRVELIGGPSWIGIRDNSGKELLSKNDYSSGDQMEFDASTYEYIRLRLGRALNVKVFINDQEVPQNPNVVTQNLIFKKEIAEQE